MKLFSQPKSSLIACLLGGISAFALGCVISVGNDDAGSEKGCGDLLTHSYQDGDQCFCDSGYNWCNASDPDDYTCCKDTPKQPDSCNQPHNVVIDNSCYCESGYTWCNPDNADDFSCCESSQSSGSSGSDAGTGTDSDSNGTTDAETETGSAMCDGEYEAPPESCDPATELAYCTTLTEMCAGESEYFICDTNGTWIPGDGDLDCQLLEWEFSYGCVWEGDVIEQICGNGPGTPCSNNDPDSCADGDVLNYCAYSKLSAVSCLEQCTVTGDEEGITYDYGSCGEQDGEFKCLCCDFDDPNCGTDSGTTGGSTGG
ncbi:MAG: hypothetical protein R3A79_29810 [Nannocystaceae bacterium]